MKRRPRITKGDSGWVIELPRYGFTAREPLGPYESHTEAMRHLRNREGPGGSPQVALAATPEPPGYTYGERRMWPPIIR
ncbi:hypothetical protein H0B56_12190 [Haloechinothrix sp. YIM 98757]|uniref:DUF2188 domain-containing protein n=1 Tax=Haloechinothrix aidingensis TaxID=2752311 RepID=A0A838AAN0_9PSEU|nr:hypothetical protein [Haloechinothrix aidingensis]MBA0126302.1 hypothetical protein [Haloechinothrix aidingensis]